MPEPIRITKENTMNDFPRNTAADDPLIKMLVGMEPGGQGIYAQEAQGQREVVNSTALPTDLGNGDDTDQDYEALGFVFGEVNPVDPLFRQATLPQGWTKQGTEHSMWSKIVDERGIERVSIFYKAAFYDRRAFMRLSNPGYEMVSKAIYSDDGDDLAEALRPLPLLTEAELAQAWVAVGDYEKYAKDSPNVYGKHGSRLAQISEALKAVAR